MKLSSPISSAEHDRQRPPCAAASGRTSGGGERQDIVAGHRPEQVRQIPDPRMTAIASPAAKPARDRRCRSGVDSTPAAISAAATVDADEGHRRREQDPQPIDPKTTRRGTAAARSRAAARRRSPARDRDAGERGDPLDLAGDLLELGLRELDMGVDEAPWRRRGSRRSARGSRGGRRRRRRRRRRSGSDRAGPAGAAASRRRRGRTGGGVVGRRRAAAEVAASAPWTRARHRRRADRPTG